MMRVDTKFSQAEKHKANRLIPLYNQKYQYFFKRFSIDTSFVLDEPEKRINNTVHKARPNIIVHMNVANNTAEIGVKAY